MSLLIETPPTTTARPPKRRAALLLAALAVGGGAAGAGVLAAAGALDGGGSTTTTVVQRIADTSSGTGTSLDARALYRTASAGTVDITSRGVSTQSGSGTAAGSGFVADASGHIVTAAHVVEGASSVTVRLQDGTTRRATVLGTDNATDVAVLKIDATGLTLHPLSLGSSGRLVVGDSVAAIGDPFTYDRSISTGIVSGLDRTIEAPNGFTVAHAIQTDAALNPGNSGGPLLDSQGRVIGVVDQIATQGSSEQSSGVGFAVPIDLVAKELQQLIKGQTVRHAYLGVSTSDAASTTSGALIGQVTASGPAERAGLRAGDVVTAVDGRTITGTGDLVAAIATHAPGDQLALTVRRGSQTLKITASLGTQPTQRSATIG